MTRIAIILPTNNRDMLNQADIDQCIAQTPEHQDCQYDVLYPETHLDQLNSVEDVETVIPAVQESINQAREARYDGIIIYGFGDVGISEEDEYSSPPVMGLGRLTLRAMATLQAGPITVMHMQPGHEAFIEALVNEESLNSRYERAPLAIGLDPKDLRNNPQAQQKLYQAASAAITEKGCSVLSVGCGSFIGLADKLQEKLQNEFGNHIHVIDPMQTALLGMKEKIMQTR